MARLLDSKLDELDAEISAIEQKKRGYLYDCRLYDEDNILCGSSHFDFGKAAVQEFIDEEKRAQEKALEQSDRIVGACGEYGRYLCSHLRIHPESPEYQEVYCEAVDYFAKARDISEYPVCNLENPLKSFVYKGLKNVIRRHATKKKREAERFVSSELLNDSGETTDIFDLIPDSRSEQVLSLVEDNELVSAVEMLASDRYSESGVDLLCFCYVAVKTGYQINDAQFAVECSLLGIDSPREIEEELRSKPEALEVLRNISICGESYQDASECIAEVLRRYLYCGEEIDKMLCK
jgi:hypothetical protein